MTDEDVGTTPGNWISNAAVKVMPAQLQGGSVVFDAARRFEVGAHLSLWGGLSLFRNQSFALFGHDGQSHAVGPLEARLGAASRPGPGSGSGSGVIADGRKLPQKHDDGSFPPPAWEPTWNLTESTMIQPSSRGFFSPNHTWGLISLDWTVARDVWEAEGRGRQTCEAVSAEGCRRLKAAGKAKRCFICERTPTRLRTHTPPRTLDS